MTDETKTEGGAADEARYVEDLTERDDFSRWYLDLVYKTELADESPVRGCMVIRPYGYALWEHMVRLLDDRIKALHPWHLPGTRGRARQRVRPGGRLGDARGQKRA